MLGSVSPDGVVVGSLQANLADMRRVRIEVADEGEETGREVLVEEQLHAGGTETNLRSRSERRGRHGCPRRLRRGSPGGSLLRSFAMARISGPRSPCSG